MRPFTKFVQKKFGQRKLIGAEIGVQQGDNALSIVGALQFGQLILIDIWSAYRIANKYDEDSKTTNFSNFYPIVVQRFGKRSDIIILRETSVEASKKFSENYFNFIYIDACHSYEAVKEDIKVWFSKVRISGIFGGHDYGQKIYPGLKRAVDEFIKENNYKLYQEGLDWWIVK